MGPLAHSGTPHGYDKHPSIHMNSVRCLCTSHALAAQQWSAEKILSFNPNKGQEGTNKQATKITSTLSIRQRSGSKGNFWINYLSIHEATLFPALATKTPTFFRPKRVDNKPPLPETATRHNSFMDFNLILFARVSQNSLILHYEGPKQATFGSSNTQKGTKGPVWIAVCGNIDHTHTGRAATLLIR